MDKRCRVSRSRGSSSLGCGTSDLHRQSKENAYRSRVPEEEVLSMQAVAQVPASRGLGSGVQFLPSSGQSLVQ